MLLYIVATPIYSPTKSVGRFPLLQVVSHFNLYLHFKNLLKKSIAINVMYYNGF